MTSRALLGLALGAGVAACAAIPTLTFVADEASTPDAQASTDGAAPRADATTTDGPSLIGSPDAGTDSASDDAMPAGDAGDAAPPPTDAGLACLPDGAPTGARCCANGTPCIGPACEVVWCNQCNCNPGLYCCAKENGGGKVQSTVCSNNPTGPQCPAQ